MTDAKDLARGKWHSILISLGISENFLVNKHGPCPVCGGSDRFRFDDKNGDGTYYCNNCGAGDGFDLAMKFLNVDFKTIAEKISPISEDAKYSKPKEKKDPRIRINALRKRIVLAKSGDDVAKYLKGRGIARGNKNIGMISGLEYYEKGKAINKYSAMACPITDKDGKLSSYHLTYIKNGAKAEVESPKKILPPIGTIKGCSIKFGIGEHIIISEGIENTLAAMQDFRLPGWAACNALCMESLEVNEAVRMVTIIVDNDKNYRGHRAAYTLANRLVMSGVKVKEIVVPFKAGDDYLSMAYPEFNS